MKLEFYIPSSRAGTRLHGIQWIPDGPVTASLQLCHGMIEHVGRYSELAEYLCRRGIAAAGCDHLAMAERRIRRTGAFSTRRRESSGCWRIFRLLLII